MEGAGVRWVSVGEVGAKWGLYFFIVLSPRVSDLFPYIIYSMSMMMPYIIYSMSNDDDDDDDDDP